MWHDNVTFTINPYESIEFKETIMGCGLMQVKGVKYLRNDTVYANFVKWFAETKPNLKTTVGAVIATLGGSWIEDCEEKLLSLGFEMLSEYDNLFHFKGHKQRLYILKL